MKKSLIILLLAIIAGTATTFAQQKKSGVEVLYFKANLACCKGRACNTLEAKVKEIIEKNWADGCVKFRQVKLSDTTNNELIKKYNAQSQTLIIEKTKRKKVTSIDVSSILSDFAKSNDTGRFEKELTAKINEFIK
ncbi:MAG: hypothetical protein NTX61_09200 [Bacteroidetes bacterium]|nr:hypothetical protein [Bacteroidota bacterium]